MVAPLQQTNNMNQINNSQEEKWVLCHNGADIIHLVYLKIGGNLSSGQPNMELFDTKEQAIARAKELNPSFEYKK
jgi:hypothetical protein